MAVSAEDDFIILRFFLPIRFACAWGETITSPRKNYTSLVPRPFQVIDSTRADLVLALPLLFCKAQREDDYDDSVPWV
jgi:hypothetical protein